jgi:hypothetical protein
MYIIFGTCGRVSILGVFAGTHALRIPQCLFSAGLETERIFVGWLMGDRKDA